MKKGFLVSAIALVFSSSLSNTAFAFPYSSLAIEPIVAISDTLAEITPEIIDISNRYAITKEDIIKSYDKDRLEKLFGYDYRDASLENHLLNNLNGMSTEDRDKLYRELEPKMSDINKIIQQSKQDIIHDMNKKAQHLENRINSGDQKTLKESIAYTDNYADELIEYTDTINQKTLKESNEYTDTTNKTVLEESRGYTDSITMDLVETIYDKHDSAINTSKKYTDQISDKNNKANNSKFKHLESMHAKTQIQNEARFSQMDKKMNKTAKQANSGIASVAAMSNIPYAMNTRFSLGAGLGNYRNGTAVAIGAQYQIKENVNLRSSVSWNNSDSAVVGAGVAIGW